MGGGGGGGGATQTVQMKPQVVDEYNYSMNGVDKADQYAVYYSFIRKSRNGGISFFTGW